MRPRRSNGLHNPGRSPPPRADPTGEYEYNGLHWRVVKRARTDLGADPPALDEMRVMCYSANWQLLEERIDRTFTGSFDETERAQTFWGKRYIDDAVARRRDLDANGTYDESFFYITDAQFSTVAMTNASNARVVERITYDAYGKARHHFGGDVTGDGAATQADDDAIVATVNAGNNSIGQANYKVEQDLNRDGQITNADRTTLNNLTGGSPQNALLDGLISFVKTGSGASLRHGPDNPIGYCGYVFNPETLQYTVRRRWYDPHQGRWLQRDPIGQATMFPRGLRSSVWVLGLTRVAPNQTKHRTTLPSEYIDGMVTLPPSATAGGMGGRVPVVA